LIDVRTPRPVGIQTSSRNKRINSMSLTHIHDHVELIARHEAEFLAQRTPAERFTDSVAAFVGSLRFVGAHLFAAWIVYNTLPGIHHFDHRPFSLLGTIVGLEAIVLASIILMRQTRLSRRQDERDHLMLQILLLVEKETTAVLNIDRQIAQQIGLERAANAPELRALSRETSIEDVAQTIKQTLADVEASGSTPNENLEGHLLG
jgi:uncharacterized membrane protein